MVEIRIEYLFGVIGLVIGYVIRGVQYAWVAHRHNKVVQQERVERKERAISEGNFEARELFPELADRKKPPM